MFILGEMIFGVQEILAFQLLPQNGFNPCIPDPVLSDTSYAESLLKNKNLTNELVNRLQLIFLQKTVGYQS